MTLALTVRDADAVWALSLLSAAIETTAKPARTIKIRRIGGLLVCHPSARSAPAVTLRKSRILTRFLR